MVTLRENTKRMHCLKLLHAIQYLRKRINQEKKRKKKRSKQQDINAYKRVTELLVLPC